MSNDVYHNMEDVDVINSKMKRREFFKVSGSAGMVLGGMILGSPKMWAQDQEKPATPSKPKTNVADALKVPKTPYSLPGLFPGRVCEVHNPAAIKENKINAAVVKDMVEKGITTLTGKNMKDSFGLFFKKDDIVGIKVNPVGAMMMSTRLEVVDAVIDWLRKGGLPDKNIIIWDRTDFLLQMGGFTKERYPGIGIEGLHTMDLKSFQNKDADNSLWLKKDGKHVSHGNFDMDVYYFADVEAPKDLPYLHQNVFNGKKSYFGNLLTKKLTKIINIPVFKNTGNGVSMATKNIGYGAICNTARLHRPLFFDVCTEVPAFPVIRDKMVLNILDGLRGQYDGGPMLNGQFIYEYNTMFFATDPFAMDMIGHNLMVEKRGEMKVKSFNEHPRYSQYLRNAEKMGLGITDIKKIKHIKA